MIEMTCVQRRNRITQMNTRDLADLLRFIVSLNADSEQISVDEFPLSFGQAGDVSGQQLGLGISQGCIGRQHCDQCADVNAERFGK